MAGTARHGSSSTSPAPSTAFNRVTLTGRPLGAGAAHPGRGVPAGAAATGPRRVGLPALPDPHRVAHRRAPGPHRRARAAAWAPCWSPWWRWSSPCRSASSPPWPSPSTPARCAASGWSGVVDLLAAVPSLLFGIWGFLFLSDKVVPLSQLLTDHFGWIPIFKTDPGANLTGSIFIAGIVVSLMVIPIITSVVREVFSQVPPGEKEAALALGGTRWGMIRTVVLPYGTQRHRRRVDARPGPGAGRDHRRRRCCCRRSRRSRPRSSRTAGPPCRASSPTGPGPTPSPCRA